MRTTRGAATAAVTLTLLLAAGCAAEEDTSAGGASTTTEMSEGSADAEMSGPEDDAAAEEEMSEGEDAGDMASGDAAPVYDFSATTLEGGTFEGSELAGAPAVLWFWAPWCPTCIGQIPTVTGLAEEYDGEVAVVGVGGLDDAETIREMAENDIAGPTHLVDDAGEVWQHFGMTQQSTFVVLDAEGEVVLEGQVPGSELESVVAELAG
ncbi:MULTISPECIES: redoxin family protein [unclassified Isoptericola]|uniref:TlpA family protein disulfide reductase n=1 Tax=unclassified Isoptericola TaxID=2623355 RepID=UPI0027137ADB|nr:MULTISPECIES: redoxin family protein [unclassified Isoptericola]MDO8143138.1 redoxin family protein [Isoptericola sp. 178]MDO8146999.1 redoxin family protein [Isoptericola sp. b515]MDO8150686.1 redoxin family protein [Isoptericola sp. b408]